MQEVAQRLKSLRESVGVSQAKLAALMGATQASVNRYENGQSSPPLKILRWYADFFDVSLDYIFARTEQPEGKLYEHKPKVVEAITQDNKELLYSHHRRGLPAGFSIRRKPASQPVRSGSVPVGDLYRLLHADLSLWD
mgnify:CR=1 FL=1